MAWAHVQSRITNATSLAFSSNVTSGNLLIVAIENSSANPAAPTDTLGTAYSLGGSDTSSANRVFIYYGFATSSAANTVSYTTGAGDKVLAIAEYSGVIGPVTTTNHGGSGSSSAPSSGTVTVVGSGLLLFALYGSDSAPSSITGNSVTIRQSIRNGASSSGGIGDLSVSANTAGTFTLGSSVAWGCIAVVFAGANSPSAGSFWM